MAGQLQAATGGATQIALARYMSSGRLDRRFGTGGVVQTAFANGASALALAIDAKGRAVVAGSSASSIAVARFTTAGRLDRSFGQGGLVLTSFPGREVGAQAIAVLAGGRIVVAGGGQRSDGTGGGFALARYLPSGQLDPSFSSDGLVVTTLGEEAGAQGVLIASHGRIVAAGSAQLMPGQGDQFVLTR